MTVIRTLAYVGDERWIKSTLRRSLSGTFDCGNGKIIETERSLAYPEQPELFFPWFSTGWSREEEESLP